MTTIQVISVQHLVGRTHVYVRVFGYRVDDLLQRIVEVSVSANEASDLIADATALRAFPEIEVPDHTWIKCINTGDIKMIHFNGGPA
jgi:hypothetical protein